MLKIFLNLLSWVVGLGNLVLLPTGGEKSELGWVVGLGNYSLLPTGEEEASWFG